jgi:hypothetical protein
MAPSLRTRNPDRSYTTDEKRVSEVEEASRSSKNSDVFSTGRTRKDGSRKSKAGLTESNFESE